MQLHGANQTDQTAAWHSRPRSMRTFLHPIQENLLIDIILNIFSRATELIWILTVVVGTASLSVAYSLIKLKIPQSFFSW